MSIMMKGLCRWIVRLSIAMVASQPLLAQSVLTTDDWPAGVVQRVSLPKERTYDYDFNDVKVSTLEGWLEWFGYPLPAELSGSVSGWLWAQRSDQGWFDVAGYRIEGEVTSPVLSIDSWQVAEARLRFGYSQGRWYVGSLTGNVRPNLVQATVGKVQLSATLPATAPREVQFSGSVDAAQLRPLLLGLGLSLDINNRTGSLVVAGSVPLESTASIETWQATAQLDLADVQFAQAPPLSIEGLWQLEAGHWSVAAAHVSVGAQPLELNGHGSLRESFPFTAQLTSADLDISQLLSDAQQPQLAQQIQGRGALAAQCAGNANEGISAAVADLRSERLTIRDEAMSNVDLQARLQTSANDAPQLSVELRSAELAGGSLSGQLVWAELASLYEELPARVVVDLKDLQLDKLSDRLLPVALSGVSTGQLRMNTVDAEQPEAWNGELRLKVSDFVALNSPLGNIYLSASKPSDAPHIRWQLSDALETLQVQLNTQLLQAHDAGAQATGQAEESRSASPAWSFFLGDYTASGSLQNFRTHIALNSTVPATSASSGEVIPVIASGQFQLQGSLAEGDSLWLSRGTASLDQLILSLAGQSIELRSAQLNVRPEAFRLERFEVLGSEGYAVGSALIRRDGQGQHLVKLRVAEMPVAPWLDTLSQYASAAVDGSQTLDFLQGIAGQLSVDAQLQKRADEPLGLVGWQGTIAGALQDWSRRELPLGSLGFDGKLDPHRLQLQAEGELLGGQATLATELPLPLTASDVSNWIMELGDDTATATAAGKRIDIDAALLGIELQKLMSLISGPRLGNRFSGLADVRLQTTEEAAPTGPVGRTLPVWIASLNIPQFFYERNSLAQDLQAQVRLHHGQLTIEKFSGGLASGRVHAVGNLRLTPQQRWVGDIQFDARRMQFPCLVAWINPDYADAFVGELGYSGRATLGSQWLIRGSAVVRDATVYSLPVQQLRSNVRIVLGPDGTFETLSAERVRGTALGGTLQGQVQLRGGARYELASSLRIGAGKLDQLSQALGFEHIVGTGRFDAVAQLSSDDVTDLNALVGPLQLDFEGGDAQSVPLLADLSHVIPLLQLASTNISSGRLDARLGQGQMRILSMFLDSEAFWLVGDGSASLASQRLDLNAILNTGGGLDAQLTQDARQRALTLLLPQLAVLGQIDDLIRNRTIYFHVAGTTGQPVIQLKPAQTLGRAFLQNLTRQLLVAPTAAAIANETN